MHINDILKVAVERKASDVHLKVGAHPVLRMDGRLQVMTEFKRLMQEDTIAMAFSMMSSRQKERFKTKLNLDWTKLDQRGKPAVSFDPKAAERKKLIGILDRPKSDLSRQLNRRKISIKKEPKWHCSVQLCA